MVCGDLGKRGEHGEHVLRCVVNNGKYLGSVVSIANMESIVIVVSILSIVNIEGVVNTLSLMAMVSIFGDEYMGVMSKV